MSSDKEDNVHHLPVTEAPPEEGAPVQQLTPEQLEQARALYIQQVAGMAYPFSPGVDEQKLLELTQQCIEEQQHVIEAQMLPLMMPDAVGDYPSLRVRVRGANGREGVIAAPKRLDGVEDAQPGIAWAFMTSFLLSPAVRVALRANGFEYRFEQIKDDVSRPAPTIVKP